MGQLHHNGTALSAPAGRSCRGCGEDKRDASVKTKQMKIPLATAGGKGDGGRDLDEWLVAAPRTNKTESQLRRQNTCEGKHPPFQVENEEGHEEVVRAELNHHLIRPYAPAAQLSMVQKRTKV
jgi:hypothetical protein